MKTPLLIIFAERASLYMRKYGKNIQKWIFHRKLKVATSEKTKWQAVKTSTTLDSDSRRKIPREKFHTKINTPRARENVRQLGVVTRFLRSQEYSTKFSTMV
jgi:hypothetical protein